MLQPEFTVVPPQPGKLIVSQETKKNTYPMGFTTGGLFRRESVKLAAMYSKDRDWAVLKESVLAGNSLQTRTISTANRVFREVCTRMKTLYSDEMDLFLSGTEQEQGYLLWVAVCRRYPFIAEFAREVIRERFVSLKGDLKKEDFDFFFHRKAESHPELDEIKMTTRKKLRQVVFKILREADLLLPNNSINAAILSPKFLNVVSLDHFQDLLIFPMFETEFRARG